jgi:hypothetical protein
MFFVAKTLETAYSECVTPTTFLRLCGTKYGQRNLQFHSKNYIKMSSRTSLILKIVLIAMLIYGLFSCQSDHTGVSDRSQSLYHLGVKREKSNTIKGRQDSLQQKTDHYEEIIDDDYYYGIMPKRRYGSYRSSYPTSTTNYSRPRNASSSTSRYGTSSRSSRGSSTRSSRRR